jgi:hypothetical protein
MKVKIDTKEKMHVITIAEEKLTANMTEDLKKTLLNYLQQPVALVQQRFYEENHSMVFCNLQPAVSDFLDKSDLLEILNVTLTESEAWDIVQMEEIEREYL